MQTIINMVQFVDFLAAKATKEEAIEVFSNLDMEGEGLIEVTWLLAVSVHTQYRSSVVYILVSFEPAETEGQSTRANASLAALLRASRLVHLVPTMRYLEWNGLVIRFLEWNGLMIGFLVKDRIVSGVE